MSGHDMLPPPSHGIDTPLLQLYNSRGIRESVQNSASSLKNQLWAVKRPRLLDTVFGLQRSHALR